jgi:hypothetical protein
MSTTKSPILKFFIELEDGTRKCKECEKLGVNRLYQPKTSNTSLSDHLRNKHKIDANPAIAREPTSTPLTEREKIGITKALTKWIVSDLQPFTVCEDKFFLEFVRLLNQQYHVPSRKTIRTDIFKFFESGKVTVKDVLENAPGAVSLTADIWTSLTMDSYCGVTAHFLNDEWELKRLVLDVRPMPYPHTGAAIKTVLMDIIADCLSYTM